ncbi:cystatin [Vibrio harveyi]|uniref:cystatin n=1 Tax=Vibrio TaxID=662 RepID=UPI0006806668|nr:MULTISPECIES: cystatin [Vibrio]CAH1537672.1 Cystatin [Vibrio rotiferianus]EKO3811217.1 cystatin [Vibrio harveyi]EKO3830882.1 cystatin [Vibrio harveyi]EKO3848930.1 cystatin [Vibrio harveyi]ELI6428407.1 cystatin [Vibrio harveyi]
MKLRMMWTAVLVLSALPFATSTFAVDKQMSPALKKKMQAICSSQGGVPGGWQIAKVTPDAERSLSMILHQMNATDKLKQINDVRTQVVGGIHYAMEFELKDGQVWNAIVLHSARGDYMIERHAKKGELCPKDGNS